MARLKTDIGCGFMPSERAPWKYWRSGAAETHPLTVTDLYRKKFSITAEDRIATAGSCFAGDISGHLGANGFCVLDKEPPPPYLDEAGLKAFGYSTYSARFGEIPTMRQLAQLAADAASGVVNSDDIWEQAGRYKDALRPHVEPEGYASVEEAIENRRFHLEKVRELFDEMTVFIFTLASTEAWVNSANGRVYPSAPAEVADHADAGQYACKNFTGEEVRDDFFRFRETISRRNPDAKFILTVSASPIASTCTDNHVIVANAYSKSVLRAVAGQLAESDPCIDYFPAYEIVATPWSKGFFYEADLSRVNAGGMAAVMRVFFSEHSPLNAAPAEESAPKRSREEKKKRRRQKRKKKSATAQTAEAAAA